MKYFLYCCVLLSIYACNAGDNNQLNCPINAPLFSNAIGINLINTWSANALYYSPYNESNSQQDPYIGAAYFTGVEYASNAVLLPTVSPITRYGSQQIYNYFTKFLANGPQMTIESGGPFTSLAGCGLSLIHI
jgi:hypothetical protein